MRHWPLILTLNCPSRSPVSFSNLLAGGILKSFKVLELLIIRSFLSAICCMSRGSLFDPSRLYTLSVSLSLNDFIISLLIRDYTMLRLTSSVMAYDGISGDGAGHDPARALLLTKKRQSCKVGNGSAFAVRYTCRRLLTGFGTWRCGEEKEESNGGQKQEGQGQGCKAERRETAAEGKSEE
jgi:hypothetical protein